jgi:hypothetical protein
MQSPFAFNGSPHFEQIKATPDTRGIAIAFP